MPRRRSFLLGVALLVGATAVGGCGGDGDGGQVVTVAAASSLSDAFEAIAADFEADHPGVEVRLTFGSSTTLADQIAEGVGVDVFAAADDEAMAIVADAGLLAEEPEPFAGNQLTAVSRAGEPSPLDRGGTEGFAEVGVVAMCASSAPCGRIADRRLASLFDAGVLDEDRVTRAPNARATLTALLEGDADVAVVYATDALSAGDAVVVHELGMDEQVPDARYPIASLADADDPDLARAFVEEVLGERGQQVLRAEGFLATDDGSGS